MTEYRIPITDHRNFLVEVRDGYVCLTVEEKCMCFAYSEDEDCAHCSGSGWWTSQDEGTGFPLSTLGGLIPVLQGIKDRAELETK